MSDFRDRGLGRLPSADERDRNFPVRSLLAAATPPKESRWYRTGPVLDQGDTYQCVGFSWRQWLSSAVTMTQGGPSAPEIYHAAQKVDEWEGEGYNGTSVRAGAKVLQTSGHILTYHWAFTPQDLKDFILFNLGTVVLGTNWYETMFSPDTSTGFVDVNGEVAGGHAYLCIGYSKPRDAFRCLNSWGEGFAQKGRFWLKSENMARLLSEDGEACCAIEIPTRKV